MFLKPFRVKSNTTSKSSERKRLKGRVCSSCPSLSQASLDELIPSKCVLASIRVFTHSNSNATIYTINDEPLFYECENIFCPTVYTLWRFPDILPSASTGPYVFTKLQGGADLMLPGVILPTPKLKGVQKGQLCSVNLVGNKASVGVGVALMSYDDMEANQWRGKGFKMLHLYGDRLWELGSKTKPPQLVTAQSLMTASERESDDTLIIPGVEKDETGTDSDGGNTDNDQQPQDDITTAGIDASAAAEPSGEASCLEETTDGETLASLSQEIGDRVDESSLGKPEDVDDRTSEDLDEVSEDSKAHVSDGPTPPVVPLMDDLLGDRVVPPMDDLLVECFCIAIKSKVKKEDLPMLTSTFYRSHMMPLCPLEFSLDVKKSRYKKLSKFLSAMQDEGVVKVAELSKGVESITEIDFKHSKVKGIIPKYIYLKVKTVGESSPASASSVASNLAGRVPQMTITELHIPTRKVLKVFSPYGYSSATMMTHSMVREVVTRYIRERELASPSNSRVVILDPILTDAVLKRGEAPPTELSWQQIITRILEEMRPGYSIQQSADRVVYKQTKLEPVRLTVTTRTGNKKATLVDNLDYYGISPTDVVHQVQRIAAASATVNDVSGRPQRQQVMVQGSNVKIIAKLLQEQHGVPLKYIEAVDKTKIPKTQKRQGSKR